MNNKILSYEELKYMLKSLEVLQKLHKDIYNDGAYSIKRRARHQQRAMELKKEINLLLTAIHHAKQARKLYDYKRLHDQEVIRGSCTANYISGVGTLVEEE
jgi:hypothetical protein